ncbi:WXG100 family type VII secretion target [Amycolatopsis sp. PS_44_ISF1]|uniref:WXG100 family type VII secretion target n=1 Tax=Amycolatopsis sp. PS_44_ISF1 TaxID=2974917 RepID=UPI0028DD40B6|nr:WXG100 family type VII secretion target [Amycolatopsis sp. PS_44_ISF1]MDT8911452.1 WXG100 family type VII secretion target [Amycolatopsis sp. PS_44_ISF1]
MQDTAGQFARAIESANAHLRQVNSGMAALQTSWRGEASVRFGQAMNEWEQQFDVIVGRLEDLMAATGGTGSRTGGLSGS